MGLFLGKGRGRGEPGRQDCPWTVLGRRRDIIAYSGITHLPGPAFAYKKTGGEEEGAPSLCKYKLSSLWFSLVCAAGFVQGFGLVLRKELGFLKGMFFPSSRVSIF